MDGLDTLHRQNISGWGPGKLISAVAGAAGNRQRVNAGISDKLSGLLRVSQQLVMAELPRGAMPSYGHFPVSKEPRQPISPSTETPQACAMLTT